MNPDVTSFRVVGEPVPQGSMRGFVRGGKVSLTSDNPKLHNWRDCIGWEARRHFSELMDGPIVLTAIFHITRPKSAPKSRVYPTTKPDGDKLARALFDALSNVVYRDDSQVVKHQIEKSYCLPGEQPGVTVWVSKP
jgi:crossover junction endodeoxyribonuclease RusA